ncbi:MAG: DNA translocase FtsK [Proteobacteria bacterium]|nr:DNA translocase FtsK [Pseudomonadota bacterium]
MAMHDTHDTDDSAIPLGLRLFLKARAYELLAFVLLTLIALAALALATWSTSDPSFNHATDARPANLLGYPGAALADLLAQYLGLASLALLFIPLAWVLRLFRHEVIEGLRWRILHWIFAATMAAALLSSMPQPASWPLSCGLGGQLGDILSGAVSTLFAPVLPGFGAALATGTLAALAFAFTLCRALGMSAEEGRAFIAMITSAIRGICRALLRGLLRSLSWMWYRAEDMQQRASARRSRTVPAGNRDLAPEDDIIGRLAPGNGVMRGRRVEPQLLNGHGDEMPGMDDGMEPEFDDDDAMMEAEEEPVKPVAKKAAAKPAPAKKGKPGVFALPELVLLAEPKKQARSAELSREALEENARTLEGVLDDFGVKGQILDVKPGPVVTLYELEPAPGIKSSRVISLADDIARSMSAISARVAVVQGRNAIGIELPNAKRETVYLREMFMAENFTRSTGALTVALGKNIGGEPIYADLARMPHLLIAGTTGSGKSVGINTMILSLLYRLPPERCKLIMIDPKMLELSVYEGIPHLLAPVVTDPRKAVVALKWAVREMEDRYKKMSKVGVRNIDGYNTRVNQMLEKGEKLTRTVQTGFDPETGQPTFEQEEMETAPMPYIVVIIDEMADLMMVAGKDIEGAVQRLAQMARAAGIHVVMATQRPSVDVITGTIKANFPTRISFQVTSKIDSRTILGEQGAEQLLGQGDMLYMAGGGRISRLHGPFVSDSEVEAIVKHLKAQGAPDYVEAVTEEPEEEAYGEPGAMKEGGSGDDLYDQAVAVVLRDKKVSTSYVQRRLQVGYNKAASLIERMEKEGLISAANATGKREILVPGDSARV